eukprot:5345674-Pyramimonas_sp.AAC.1
MISVCDNFNNILRRPNDLPAKKVLSHGHDVLRRACPLPRHRWHYCSSSSKVGRVQYERCRLVYHSAKCIESSCSGLCGHFFCASLFSTLGMPLVGVAVVREGREGVSSGATQ